AAFLVMVGAIFAGIFLASDLTARDTAPVSVSTAECTPNSPGPELMIPVTVVRNSFGDARLVAMSSRRIGSMEILVIQGSRRDAAIPNVIARTRASQLGKVALKVSAGTSRSPAGPEFEVLVQTPSGYEVCSAWVEP